MDRDARGNELCIARLELDRRIEARTQVDACGSGRCVLRERIVAPDAWVENANLELSSWRLRHECCRSEFDSDALVKGRIEIRPTKPEPLPSMCANDTVPRSTLPADAPTQSCSST